MSLRLTRKKRKAEDEDENEDDGCRHACAPTPDYLLLRTEAKSRRDAFGKSQRYKMNNQVTEIQQDKQQRGDCMD